MMRNTALSSVVFVLLVVGVRGVYAQERHDTTKAEAVKAQEKLLDEQLPIVDFDAPKPTDSSERLTRVNKTSALLHKRFLFHRPFSQD